MSEETNPMMKGITVVPEQKKTSLWGARLGGCFVGTGLGCFTLLLFFVVAPFILIHQATKQFATEDVESLFNSSEVLTGMVDEGLIPIRRLELNGVITGQHVSNWYKDPTSDAAVVEQITEAIGEEAVKGLLLVVNSPGGSVTASDDLYRALQRFKAVEPGRKVVVMAKDVLASGAYYLAMQADYICVQPTTVVGSIGVIMPGVNVSGLAQRLGIADNSIASGASKDLGNPLKPINPEHNAVLKTVIDGMYERFVQLVADGRKMQVSAVRKLADGRVFTAVDAKNLGLVDRIGYEDEIEDVLAELFGCKPEEIYIDERSKTSETFRAWLKCGFQEFGHGMMQGLLPAESKVPQYRW